MSGRGDLRAAEHGFTLLELLIAIALLGVLMAALFGGLRLGARVWETADARLDASMRTQIVQDFIRQRLGETLPLEATPQDLARVAGSEPLFLGTIGAVRFASLLPEDLGVGVYLMELTLTASNDPVGLKDVVLRWRPLDLNDQAMEALEREERVLLENIQTLEFSYFGTIASEQPPDWWHAWEGQPELPQLIRLRVRFAENDERRWPELIVRPMIDRFLVVQF